MASLKVDDFEAFHCAIHGFAPFAWQSRLLRKVVSDRCWPRVLDLPTGSGKTTCIDIAIFAMALDADSAPADRWCPRRVALVVDRRIVVDQAAERGRKLVGKLGDEAPVAVVRSVAERLRTLSDGGESPLAVHALRGGMPRDDGWARTPDQPTILSSTVDQIGSRLLVQGYGVSQGMKPVHAGLVANDLLLLLDEVHLSKPFAETLDAVTNLNSRFDASSKLQRRFQHVQMSATPGETKSPPFSLTTAEINGDAALRERLEVRKPARMRQATDRAALEGICVDAALDLLRVHDVVGVIVNRVQSAMTVASRLSAERRNVDVKLLSGRMRPLDRDAAWRGIEDRVKAGRERPSSDRKFVLVGTQCLEAGADIDLDALVTECASLDALRQRFGRVDRLGRYGKAEGVVVGDKSAKEDPVYGDSLLATAKWLTSSAGKGTIDFGVSAFPTPPAEILESLNAPKLSAPVLMPAYMDLWMQTSPPPATLPDVSLFLHGPRSSAADVQVVWRCDVTEEALDAALDGEEARRDLEERVSAARPSNLESVAVPFDLARRWLSGEIESFTDLADVEAVATRDSKSGGEGPLALAWRGVDSKVIRAHDLLPGQTIIVPSARGGLRGGSFDPTCDDVVPDLAEKASFLSWGVPILRMQASVLDACGLRFSDVMEDADIKASLRERADSETELVTKAWLEALAPGFVRVSPSRTQSWVLLRGKRVRPIVIQQLIAAGVTEGTTLEVTTDEDESSFVGKAVTLREHSGHVEQRARSFATSLGLPANLVEDLALAGWLHDIGKADPRFQLLLRGGSKIDYFKDETPWAKSAMPSRDASRHMEARRKSGYPTLLGREAMARHEVQSLAMLEREIDAVSKLARDVDLVLYLVSSHHGYCRPLAPVVDDTIPVNVSLDAHASASFGRLSFPGGPARLGMHGLDAGTADRFWRLVAKYGWSGLCWLESILRLADHRASAAEQEMAS